MDLDCQQRLWLRGDDTNRALIRIHARLRASEYAKAHEQPHASFHFLSLAIVTHFEPIYAEDGRISIGLKDTLEGRIVDTPAERARRRADAARLANHARLILAMIALLSDHVFADDSPPSEHDTEVAPLVSQLVPPLVAAPAAPPRLRVA